MFKFWTWIRDIAWYILSQCMWKTAKKNSAPNLRNRTPPTHGILGTFTKFLSSQSGSVAGDLELLADTKASTRATQAHDAIHHIPENSAKRAFPLKIGEFEWQSRLLATPTPRGITGKRRNKIEIYFTHKTLKHRRLQRSIGGSQCRQITKTCRQHIATWECQQNNSNS